MKPTRAPLENGWRCRDRGRRSAHAGGGCGLDVARQLRAEFADGERARRFRQHPDRAGLERGHGCGGASGGNGADDDDRDGSVLLEDFEKGQPIHPRHLDVEGQHVGVERLDHVARHVRIGRGTHDFDFRIPREGVGNHATDDRGVVHDEDFDFWIHG